MAKIRGTHSSPGVYTKITDISYPVENISRTTLGLVGETLKGPAFEPIPIKSWSEFKTYFGGTSPEKFKDTQYPKYELPYIAKSWLTQSDQLYVSRVLGLSGYDAGPAWLITVKESGSTSTQDHVIAVLRSKGVYGIGTADDCGKKKYDGLRFTCSAVSVEQATMTNMSDNCSIIDYSTSAISLEINSEDKGCFAIKCTPYEGSAITYNVSLDYNNKNYIMDVLGSNNDEGNAPVFVEELYDYYLNDLLKKTDATFTVNTGETKVDGKRFKVEFEVDGTLGDSSAEDAGPTSQDLDGTNNNKLFVYREELTSDDYTYYETNTYTDKPMELGDVVQVVKKSNTAGGNANNYTYVKIGTINTTEVATGETIDSATTAVFFTRNYTYGYIENGSFVTSTQTTDMRNYNEQYRYGVTPWIVSDAKGNGSRFDVYRLFRFVTITDGANANRQVKISVANVNIDEGTFDVYVRDYNDSDGSPVILESYRSLTMIPGTTKYIGKQIGTLNGDYELKSNYIYVDVIENDITKECVPAGFLGYPIRTYRDNLASPTISYNCDYNDTIRPRKQYFGMSDITGVDEDVLKYKGYNAYSERYENDYTRGFHFDTRISVNNEDAETYLDGGTKKTLWDTVNDTIEFTSNAKLNGTVLEDVAARKFTCYPYGGFDGWDVYRGKRTNTDEYNSSNYAITTDSAFGPVQNGDGLNLPANSNTSDYYAYLAGAKQFADREQHVINLFATPGIDYVNNRLLVDEIVEMVEEERQDTFYVVTTPDKPAGASDAPEDMFSASEAVSNLEDTGLDSWYASTYYPWAKYLDTDNNMYINLPATRDVLRNMAETDNKKYPWFAIAGTSRGKVDCVKLRNYPKVEDEDILYDGSINPLKYFSKDGVLIWGNKTLYTGDSPMNRINVVRMVLYMRRMIIEASRQLLFEPNDATLKKQFEDIIDTILREIKSNRGIIDYRLSVSQTAEQIDAHEISAVLAIKPTQTLEYIEIEFEVTPQGVDFAEM